MTRDLYRKYPELFEVANRVMDLACTAALRRQALWLVRGEWKTGPVDGARFNRRPPDSMLAGVYDLHALPDEIVSDMLLTLRAKPPVLRAKPMLVCAKTLAANA